MRITVLNFMLTIAILSLISIQFSSCNKNQFITNPGAGLVFEVDTLTFDTVFTKLGNATRRFKVFNRHKQPIMISNVRLGGGNLSDYKINIDGYTGHSSSNIEIPAEDSIYIFANVYIDPSNGDAIREDSIVFETAGGGSQSVILNAYGWNATYIGDIGYITTFNSNVTLTAGKPYIFMGYIRFKDACLTIQAGTEIFMYGGPSSLPGGRAAIIIDTNACIKSNVGGDLNNPVEIKTHRLEADYQDIAFHHQGIVLKAFSRDNQIHGTIIRNAVDGVQVEGGSTNTNPKLEIKNSYIYNVDRSGILGIAGDIKAENLVIANSNKYNVIAIYGGTYDFKHCTFANYGAKYARRSEAILSFRDYSVGVDSNENEIVYVNNDPSYAHFTNSIIYGSKKEETEFLLGNGANPNYTYSFDYCLMKVDTFSQGILSSCITNQKPLFVDKEDLNYEIDSTASPAYQAATPIGILQDANNKNRSVNTPSIGAYEIN